MMMSVRPIIAGISSDCPKTSQAISVTSTIPIPDQIAYAIPTGIVRNVSDKKKKAVA